MIKSAAAASPAVKTGSAAVTKLERGIAAAVGMGCPCDTPVAAYNALNGSRRRNARLRMPALVEMSNDNYLQTAMNNGRMAS